MAKKEVKIINPSDAVRAIQEYQARLGGLFSILPTAIDFIRDMKSDNEPMKDHLLKVLTEHLDKVNEYRNHFEE